ncbi:stromal cell-derived factor 2 isoform X1 [Phyllopteryx taeniolatus]|uniref:stromal cell-derived factor 2 isoform X1 n=1 Tax=Phyllopteryx taeniolatus TaxID=161469 RepID=UPI002AD596C5|nr:stromal cell-derived factor 2 isoform X1 [Phyllopteryx taeniolatus]
MDSFSRDLLFRLFACVFVFWALLFRSSLCTELTSVTCGSVLKLLNVKHNVRLHSHDVRYGSEDTPSTLLPASLITLAAAVQSSGSSSRPPACFYLRSCSGQQSVTGVTSVEDSNSYWSVRGTRDAACLRGNAVKCGQNIRLTHVNTGRNLHSHYFSSPLSSNQEVSAFGEEGEGDHLDEWTVECGGAVWKRAEAVRFRHKATEAALAVTGEQYGRPIGGQREVHAMAGSGQHSLWKAMEGVFVKLADAPPPPGRSRQAHGVLNTFGSFWILAGKLGFTDLLSLTSGQTTSRRKTCALFCCSGEQYIWIIQRQNRSGDFIHRFGSNAVLTAHTLM